MSVTHFWFGAIAVNSRFRTLAAGCFEDQPASSADEFFPPSSADSQFFHGFGDRVPAGRFKIVAVPEFLGNLRGSMESYPSPDTPEPHTHECGRIAGTAHSHGLIPRVVIARTAHAQNPAHLCAELLSVLVDPGRTSQLILCSTPSPFRIALLQLGSPELLPQTFDLRTQFVHGSVLTNGFRCRSELPVPVAASGHSRRRTSRRPEWNSLLR